jgi:threonine/homoserine/homoserine lactone efflux protein
MHEFAAFLGVSVFVIVTPGQDTALTIRNTLAGGRRAGVFTAWGVSSGQVTWALATSAGLSALVLASESAFVVLKVVGAVYLAYLGARALWSAFRGDNEPETHASPARSPRSGVVAYRQGLVSNLSNPKIAVFFTSLLPQFAGRHAPFLSLLGLGVVFASMTFAWLTGYAFAVARAGDFLRRRQIRQRIEAVTGAVLLGLGVRLATERR